MGVLGEKSGHQKVADQEVFVNVQQGSAESSPGEFVGFRLDNGKSVGAQVIPRSVNPL